MAPFLFGSIEPKARKNQFWFTSAFLVLLAGFFSLGLSISNPNSEIIQASNYELKLDKKEKNLEIVAKPKLKVKIIDKQKIEAEEKARKEAEQKQREAEATAQAAKQVPTTQVVYSAPTFNGDLNDLYQRAAAMYGLDWRVLAAVHMVESGQATQCAAVSYAGATGPMQFLPSTFNYYAIDGDGDGVTDICNVSDAVFSAANLLATNWGATDMRVALYHYNHSDYYVNHVLSLASSL
ncbi:MAG: lytic murein transglycosylase [Patescibacteria group bacterium]|nr:lytic murein transglycosylase [Patescibacteria group bacterium]